MPITYPIDIEATRGKWAHYRISTQEITVWGDSWPRSDGGPRVDANPDIAYLLVDDQRPGPGDYDQRFRTVAEGETTIVIDPLPVGAPPDQGIVGTLTRSYTTPLLPADQLKAAVSSVAEDRIAAVVQTMGIRSPADLLLCVAALKRKSDGQALNTRQNALLAILTAQTDEWLDQTYVREGEIHTWIDEHPGQMPDVTDSAWPALPEVGA